MVSAGRFIRRSVVRRCISRRSREHVSREGSACLVQKRHSSPNKRDIVHFPGRCSVLFCKGETAPPPCSRALLRELPAQSPPLCSCRSSSASSSEMPCVTLVRALLTLGESLRRESEQRESRSREETTRAESAGKRGNGKKRCESARRDIRDDRRPRATAQGLTHVACTYLATR